MEYSINNCENILEMNKYIKVEQDKFKVNYDTCNFKENKYNKVNAKNTTFTLKSSCLLTDPANIYNRNNVLNKSFFTNEDYYNISLNTNPNVNHIINNNFSNYYNLNKNDSKNTFNNHDNSFNILNNKIPKDTEIHLNDKSKINNINNSFLDILNSNTSYFLKKGWLSNSFYDDSLEEEYKNNYIKKSVLNCEKFAFILGLIYVISTNIYILSAKSEMSDYYYDFIIYFHSISMFLCAFFIALILLIVKYNSNMHNILRYMYFYNLILFIIVHIYVIRFSKNLEIKISFSTSFFPSFILVCTSYICLIPNSKLICLSMSTYCILVCILASYVNNYASPFYTYKMSLINIDNINDFKKIAKCFDSNIQINQSIQIYAFHGICSIACYLIYYLKQILENFTRNSFISMKKLENLHRYYNKFVNEGDFQVISFSKKDIVYVNDSFIFNSNLDFELTKYNNNFNTKCFNNCDIIYNKCYRYLSGITPCDIHKNSNFDDNNNINYNNYTCNLNLQEIVNIVLNNDSKTVCNLKEKIVNKYYSNSNYNVDFVNNLLELIENSKNETFKELGMFYSNQNNSIKYYQVVVRKFFLNSNNKFIDNNDIILNKNYVFDIVIKDVTKLLVTERVSVENSLKNKLFSKMAHEFKTPLIIISNELSDLTGEFIDKYNNVINSLYKINNIKKNKEYKEIISYSIEYKNKYENLNYISKYCLYLIDDIIHYASGCCEYNVQIEKDANMRNLIEFCHKALIGYKSYLPGDKSDIICNYYIEDKVDDYIVDTDLLRLKQVILNLLSNAIKFTNKGSVSISCSIVNFNHKDTNNLSKDMLTITNTKHNSLTSVIKLIDTPNSNNNSKIDNTTYLKTNLDNKCNKKLLILIEDTGTGISNNKLRDVNKNINEYTTLPTTKRPSSSIKTNSISIKSLNTEYNYMGTGIGLNIVKDIINKLPNHKFYIKSTKNLGTKCYIYINATKRTKDILSNEIKNINNHSKTTKKLINFNNNVNSNKFISSKKNKSSFYLTNLKLNNYCNNNKFKNLNINIKSKPLYNANNRSYSSIKSNYIIQTNNLSNDKLNDTKIINDYPALINYKELINNAEVIVNKNNCIVNKHELNSIDNINYSSNNSSNNRSIISNVKTCKTIYKIQHVNKFCFVNNNFKANLINNLNNYNINKPTILLVDDSIQIRKSIKKIIFKSKEINKVFKCKNNYNVIELSDGIELLYTIKYFQQNSSNNVNNIKLIVSDENMEYLNGSDTIKIIKKLASCNKVFDFNIISLTAFVDNETINSIISSGANAVLHKPLNNHRFDECLTKYFKFNSDI